MTTSKLSKKHIDTVKFQFANVRRGRYMKPQPQQYGMWIFSFSHGEDFGFSGTYQEASTAALEVANRRGAYSIEVLP